MKIRFLEKTFVGTGGNVFPGDEREISEGEAAALVRNGVLKEPGKKAEPALKNKMEAAPANKAARASKSKRR